MFNLPNPGSNPANPFYHRTLEEQRRTLQEAVTVELQFKKDSDGKKSGGKKVRDKVYKMTFKNDAEMNKFMDTNAKILDEGTEELEESTPEYRAMMKKYKGSDAEKVFKILDKEGFRMGEQSDTLVRNMLKKHRGNVKKAADQIMKDNPGMFDVNRMMMDHVEIDEAEVYKRPAKVSALGGQKFHAIVANNMIVAAGMTEKEAKKMRKFGQTVLELPGAKVGQKLREDVEQVDESRDDFDYLDVEAARQDAKLEAPKVVKTRQGYQVMVFSRKLRKHIPQGSPHRTKAAAEKDAKMFEEVTRLKEPRRVQKKKQTRKAKPSMLPAYDARLLRQALVLGKNAFKAGKKREPIKDPNLVKLKGFATGEGKNEVMKQWLKGWDEMNLKDDVQIDEASKMGLKKLSQGARTILASAINMSMDGVPGMDSPAANERNLGKFSEGDYDKAIKYLRKSFSKGLLPKGQQYAKEVIKMMEESVELDEAKAEFQFSDKATALKFMREVLQARQGSSTGTRDGKVTTDFTDLGDLELKNVAKIMKKYGGKLIKISERQMAKVFEEYTELEEERGSKIQVMVKGDRNAYERLTRAITMGKVPGYEGAMFKGNMTTLTFDAKKHTGAVRRKLAKMIKDSGGEFDRSIEEGFASDAQRRAAFASGYKAKGKKKNEEEMEEEDITLPKKPKNAIKKPKIDSRQTTGY